MFFLTEPSVLIDKLNAAKAENKALLLLISRRGETRFVALKAEQA